MAKWPDFIGLGAQKGGTSWIYACLYEHPQIYMPIKEIHFFSHEDKWSKGYDWYESKFSGCPVNRKAGEFSTTYFSNPVIPRRISQRYPGANLIVSLRNPINRAYSNYVNDMKAGVVKRSTSFTEAMAEHPEYLERGRYAVQLRKYFEYFKKEQLLVLIYEECLSEPLDFIQSIYRFIGVDETFVPTMVHMTVNPGCIPRSVIFDRVLVHTSDVFQKGCFKKIWWIAKKSGFGNFLRYLNTGNKENNFGKITEKEFNILYHTIETDIDALEELIGGSLALWRKLT